MGMEVRDRIKGMMAEEGVTQVELARRMGISVGALRKRMGRDMKVSFMLGAVRALGYDVYIGKGGNARKL